MEAWATPKDELGESKTQDVTRPELGSRSKLVRSEESIRQLMENKTSINAEECKSNEGSSDVNYVGITGSIENQLTEGNIGKINNGKKSFITNYRGKKRKGSNRSLISSKRKLHSNPSKILTVKESLKD